MLLFYYNYYILNMTPNVQLSGSYMPIFFKNINIFIGIHGFNFGLKLITVFCFFFASLFPTTHHFPQPTAPYFI